MSGARLFWLPRSALHKSGPVIPAAVDCLAPGSSKRPSFCHKTDALQSGMLPHGRPDNA